MQLRKGELLAAPCTLLGAPHNHSVRTLFAPETLQSGLVELTPAEAQHGRTVLRLKTGDTVRLVDGCGGTAEGAVERVDRKGLAVAVGEVIQHEPHVAQQLRVAMAPAKGGRFDDCVRMLTELGVGGIHALNCERVSRMPDEERSLRIAAEALKQCRRTWLPDVQSVPDFSTLAGLPGQLIVLDAQGAADVITEPQPTTIVVGPEGGFTSDELAELVTMGAKTNAGSWAHLAYRNGCGCRGIVMGSRLGETA